MPFSRTHLKRGLVISSIVLVVAACVQTQIPFGKMWEDVFYLVETGSGASSVALCLALIATA